ncbi:MAG: UDP-N-acetylmuramoyl-L-alanine--D-glutamate ligase [Myxococcota bacterium]
MTLPWPDKRVLARIDELLDQPQRYRFGVVGLGIAGRAMAQHLVRRGAKVIGADAREDYPVAQLKNVDIEVRLGKMDAATFTDVDALVLSPGVDPRQDIVRHALDSGLPVFGELELLRQLPAPVVAITGTNGKSTTTALLGQLIESTGKQVFVGGNLGDPIATWIDSGRSVDVAVLELSSFQLETAYRFRPDVAVILNVTPDHGERYARIEDYIGAKRRILEGLEPENYAILNRDDETVRSMASATQGMPLWFSKSQGSDFRESFELERGIQGGILLGDTFKVHALGLSCDLPLDHPKLVGLHNRDNAMAAVLAMHALGLLKGDVEGFRRGYLAFQGLPHRLEWVDEIDDVLWVNDSKATNDESAAIAVQAFERPVIALVGGRDKGMGYERLRQACQHKARAVITYGEAGSIISEVLAQHRSVYACVTMKEALQRAREISRPGDVVVLAPACSSFDEFSDYQDRGRVFKAFVHSLRGLCTGGVA